MTTDLGFWVLQTLNALQLSMLLFLLSVGLTVIFELMHFVNLAHGSLYAFGAYVAATLAGSLGYWGGFLLAPVAVAALGAVLYFTLIRSQRRAGQMAQVLVTFGLILPSRHISNSLATLRAWPSGSRITAAPQNTPRTSQDLSNVRLSGSFGIPAVKPTTR